MAAAQLPAGVVLEMPAPPLTFSFRLRAALPPREPGDPGPQTATELFAAVLSCPALGSRALPQNTRSIQQKHLAFTTIPGRQQEKFDRILATADAWLLRVEADPSLAAGTPQGAAQGATQGNPGAPAPKVPKVPTQRAMDAAAARARVSAAKKAEKVAAKAAKEAAAEAAKAAAAAKEAARLEAARPETPLAYATRCQAGAAIAAEEMVPRWARMRRQTELTRFPPSTPLTYSPLRIVLGELVQGLPGWAVVRCLTPVLAAAFSGRFRPRFAPSPEYRKAVSEAWQREQHELRDRIARSSAQELVETTDDEVPSVDAVLAHVQGALLGALFPRGAGHAALRAAVLNDHLPAAVRVRAMPGAHALLKLASTFRVNSVTAALARTRH